MRIAVQYLSDIQGHTQAVQLPITEWKKIVAKLNKYDQTFKLKANLTNAFKEVDLMQKSKKRKQNLVDFLDGL